MQCRYTKLSDWQKLERGTNPYVDFNPNKESIEFKVAVPVDKEKDLSFDIKVQLMKADNDAEEATLRVEEDGAKLSFKSIKYCKARVNDATAIPNMNKLKVDLRKEAFLVPVISGSERQDLYIFGSCRSIVNLRMLRPMILSASTTRMKITLQASDGLGVFFKVITNGKRLFYQSFIFLNTQQNSNIER